MAGSDSGTWSPAAASASRLVSSCLFFHLRSARTTLSWPVAAGMAWSDSSTWVLAGRYEACGSGPASTVWAMYGPWRSAPMARHWPARGDVESDCGTWRQAASLLTSGGRQRSRLPSVLRGPSWPAAAGIKPSGYGTSRLAVTWPLSLVTREPCNPSHSTGTGPSSPAAVTTRSGYGRCGLAAAFLPSLALLANGYIIRYIRFHLIPIVRYWRAAVMKTSSYGMWKMVVTLPL